MNSNFADIESLITRHCTRLMGGNAATLPTSGRRNITEPVKRAPVAWQIAYKEQQQYVALSENGHTPGEIGDMFGRSPQAVRHVLRKHGARINSVRDQQA